MSPKGRILKVKKNGILALAQLDIKLNEKGNNEFCQLWTISWLVIIIIHVTPQNYFI